MKMMEGSFCLSEDCPISWKRLAYTLKWKRITVLFAISMLLAILVLSILTQKSVHDLRRDLFLAQSIPVDDNMMRNSRPTAYTSGSKSTKGFKEVDLSLLALDGFYPEVPISKVKSVNDYDNPDLSFAVVIDCGSSGSRLFVYRWPKHSGNEYDLLKIEHMKTKDDKIVVKKVEPGISSFASRPYEIVRYITPLLRYAEQNIPQEKHESTPLYLLCTAGMRLLPQAQQDKVINALKSEIPLLTDFLFEDSHAEVITGQTEGLYSWISLNYVLGNMEGKQDMPIDDSIRSDENDSVGIIDMGGGSLQIAYEVSSDQRYNSREHILDINLSGDEKIQSHRYKVYVETFLGKGANSVKSSYENMMLNQYSSLITEPTTTPEHREVVEDPCASKGMEKFLPTKNGETLFLNGTGDFNACKAQLKLFLHKEKCKVNDTECIIDGELRPKINFFQDDFFGISEFYYTMEDVLHMSGNYNKKSFEEEAAEFCQQDWKQSFKLFKNGEYPIADEFRMRTQCLKSAWMSVVFHEGLNFPSNYSKFSSVKVIKNNEIQWTLGALLYKARYLPLREIQQAKIKHKAVHNSFFLLNFISQNTIILILCIVIVMFSVLLYGIRFWLSHNQHRVASLKRVGSSVAYFVHEDIV